MTSHPALEPRARPHRPSLGRALQRFVEATQRLAADRTDLLKVEAGQEMREAMRGLVRAITGVLLLTAGWALLVAAAVIWCARFAPLEYVLAGIGALHALVGALVASRVNGAGG
jgi:uncharacterized membrane protein YqjE